MHRRQSTHVPSSGASGHVRGRSVPSGRLVQLFARIGGRRCCTRRSTPDKGGPTREYEEHHLSWTSPTSGRTRPVRSSTEGRKPSRLRSCEWLRSAATTEWVPYSFFLRLSRPNPHGTRCASLSRIPLSVADGVLNRGRPFGSNRVRLSTAEETI